MQRKTISVTPAEKEAFTSDNVKLSEVKERRKKAADMPNYLDTFFLRDPEQIVSNARLTERSREVLRVSKADSTLDSYESDWHDFCEWCFYNNAAPYPASPETVVNYINDLSQYAKTNTIARRVTAISENYGASALADQNPCTSFLVKNALKGIRRLYGSQSQGKEPVLLEDIRDMVQSITGTPLQVARDKAILLTGFMGAFRRSELAALEVSDIRFSRLGARIQLRKSKADQQGRGAVVAIPRIEDDPDICAVQALEEWLSLSHISAGPVFRGFTRSGEPRQTAISDKSIAMIVKKYVEKIGMDPSLYGAHSLRHGFATSAAQARVEERDIMKHTRHHSREMVRRYIDEADMLISSPIAKMVKPK